MIGSLQSNFIEITLRYGCSPINFLHIFRIPFPNNTYGGLLLKVHNSMISVMDYGVLLINTMTTLKMTTFFALKYVDGDFLE